MVMRVLFTAQLGHGHWRPLAPLAQTLVKAGHHVAFVTTPYFCAAIRKHGLTAFPVGVDDWIDQPSDPPDPRGEPMQAADVAIHVFVPRAEHNLPELLALCREWQPDLIVREHTEFAGCLAAEHLDIPHAAVQISAFRGTTANQPLSAPLNRLRAALDLMPDPTLDMLYRYLLLLPFPASYRSPTATLPSTAHFVRHVSFDLEDPADVQLPTWIERLRPRPTIYASLGTAYNHFPQIFQAILEGLRDEPINLIMTTNDLDPRDFGPQPDHVHIARYLPQSRVFPYCDLVITHGGSGTVRTALEHGLPMVVIPIAADQPDNARRCADLGLGRVVALDQRTARTIRDATRDVLSDPSYRWVAQRLRAEMQSLPGPDSTVTLLTQLAQERQPLMR